MSVMSHRSNLENGPFQGRLCIICGIGERTRVYLCSFDHLRTAHALPNRHSIIAASLPACRSALV